MTDPTVRTKAPLPNAPRVLVIMDVDGTMLYNGKALSVEFRRAFQEVAGVDVANYTIQFAGSTDRRIVRDFIEAAGVEGDYEDLYQRFTERFCELVEASYPSHPSPRVLPGVVDTLTVLHEHRDVGLVLGTGNIRRSCEIKLERFGLDRFFPHGGGFGGDHEVRADAIRAAMQVGRDGFGWAGEAWVVGDTVNDALAAHDAGAKALLVETGMVPKDDLHQTGAEAVLPDLTDTAAVLEVFGLSVPDQIGETGPATRP